MAGLLRRDPTSTRPRCGARQLVRDLIDARDTAASWFLPASRLSISGAVSAVWCPEVGLTPQVNPLLGQQMSHCSRVLASTMSTSPLGFHLELREGGLGAPLLLFERVDDALRRWHPSVEWHPLQLS